MNNTFLIRAARTSDLDRLASLYVQLSPDNTPLSTTAAETVFNRFSLYEGSAILIGEIDGVLVASCMIVIIPNLTRAGKPFGLIENVITHPDHRRRGYALSLLDAATNQAWDYGCYKVMLMTGSKDRDTLAFYDRAGFEQSKTGFQKRKFAKRK